MKPEESKEKEGEAPASGSSGRWCLPLSSAERKVLIALAVSGEAERVEEIAAAAELSAGEVEKILVTLAGQGFVETVKEEAEALVVASEREQEIPAAATTTSPAASYPLPSSSPEVRPSEAAEIIEDLMPEKPSPPEADKVWEVESLRSYLESLKDKNYYQMLGVGPKAGRAEIRRVYYQLAAEFHPDRHRECADPAVQAVLAELFALLTEAYETLHRPKRRRFYDRTIPEFTGAVESEEEEALARLFEEKGEPVPAKGKEADRPLGWNFYLAAVEAFQTGDYQTADLNFKLAAGLDPERPEYQEGLQRTREIISRNMLEELKREARTLEEQRRYHEAVVALVKAVELDPVDAELRYSLARLRFLKTLDRLRAEEDISWAVSLDPNHVDALLLMGRIQAWKGNTDAAIATFKQVLRLAPGHPKAKQALALFEK